MPEELDRPAIGKERFPNYDISKEIEYQRKLGKYNDNYIYTNTRGNPVYQDGWTWYELVDGIWEERPDV